MVIALIPLAFPNDYPLSAPLPHNTFRSRKEHIISDRAMNRKTPSRHIAVDMSPSTDTGVLIAQYRDALGNERRVYRDGQGRAIVHDISHDGHEQHVLDGQVV